MLRTSGAPAGHHRNSNRVGHGLGNFQIVTVLGPVGVHRGEHDLAGAQALDLPGPGHGLQARGHAPAVYVHLPKLLIILYNTFWVYIHYYTLASESPGGLADELGIAAGGRIDRNLVGPGYKQCPDILDRADTAPHGKGHENHLRRTPNHIQHDIPALVTGRNIQKNQLVGPFLLVARSHLHRITRIAEIHEIRTLNNPPAIHIQAGNDAFCEHRLVIGYQFTVFSLAASGHHRAPRRSRGRHGRRAGG